MSDEVNKVPVYAEPEGIDYIIIKVKESSINDCSGGSLYEATRRAWRAKLESAMPYKYVLSVVGGIVKEVYHVSRWYTSPTEAPRIEFDGEVAEFSVRDLFIGKMIPECYRQKGLASPFLYKKKAGAPAAVPAQEETSAADALKAAALKKAEEAAIKAKAEAQAQAAAAAALAKAEAEAKAKAEAEAKAKAEAEAKAKAEAEAKAKAEAEAKAKAEAEAKAKAEAEAEAKAKVEAEAKAKAEAEAKVKAEAEAKAKAEAEAKAKAEAEAKAKAEAEAKAKAEAEAKAKAEAEAKAKAEAEAKAKAKAEAEAAKNKNRYDTVGKNVNLDEEAVALCQKYGVDFSPINTVYLCSNLMVAYMWLLKNPTKMICDYNPPYYFFSYGTGRYKEGKNATVVPYNDDEYYYYVYFFVNKVVLRTDHDNRQPDINTPWGAINQVSRQMRGVFRWMPDQNEQALKDSGIVVKLFVKYFPQKGIDGVYFRDFIGAFYHYAHNTEANEIESVYEYFNYILDNALSSPLWREKGVSLYEIEKVGADYEDDISDLDLQVLVRLFDDYYDHIILDKDCRTMNLYCMALRGGRRWSKNKETLFYHILEKEKPFVGKWGDSTDREFLANTFKKIIDAYNSHDRVPAPIYKFLCDLFIMNLPKFPKQQVIAILDGFLNTRNLEADKSLVQ